MSVLGAWAGRVSRVAGARVHGLDSRARVRRRRSRDGPTPELKSLREWYAGAGDPNLTTYPLGVLLANEAISEDQHRAGDDFLLSSASTGRRSAS